MDMIPVESSMIAAVGYDPKTKTLNVLFNSGKNLRLSRCATGRI
jgi:KTSC domain